MKHHSILIAALAATPQVFGQSAATETVRVPIRAITKLHGEMTNTLTGLGLVTGLNGTGSTDRATRQAISNFVQRFNLNIEASAINAGATALVSVSAELPSFANVGMQFDVRVKAVGEMESLRGGYLEPCELVYFDGADSTVWATASGAVTTGGLSVTTSTTRLVRDVPTTGKVGLGAKVVQQPPEPELLSEDGKLEIALSQPSLVTAQNIVRSINRSLASAGVKAKIRNRALVQITLPEKHRNRDGALRTLGLVGNLKTAVEQPQRVVIDTDTGTIIAGAEVKISPCVISTSDVIISVVDEQNIVQPLPFSRGRTARINRSAAEVTIDDPSPVSIDGGATVSELVQNLRALGLTTRQMIEVFEQLHASHFLHAPLVIR